MSGRRAKEGRFHLLPPSLADKGRGFAPLLTSVDAAVRLRRAIVVLVVAAAATTSELYSYLVIYLSLRRGRRRSAYFVLSSFENVLYARARIASITATD